MFAISCKIALISSGSAVLARIVGVLVVVDSRLRASPRRRKTSLAVRALAGIHAPLMGSWRSIEQPLKLLDRHRSKVDRRVRHSHSSALLHMVDAMHLAVPDVPVADHGRLNK